MPKEITFSEAKVGLDQAATDLQRSNTQLDAGIVQINAGDSTLNNMGSDYSELKQDIDHTAALYPTNTAWQNVKEEMDLLLGDRQTLKTWSGDLVTAIDGIPKPIG